MTSGHTNMILLVKQKLKNFEVSIPLVFNLSLIISYVKLITFSKYFVMLHVFWKVVYWIFFFFAFLVTRVLCVWKCSTCFKEFNLFMRHEYKPKDIFGHFEPFFALLSPLMILKIKILKKNEKHAWRYYPFIDTCVP